MKIKNLVLFSLFLLIGCAAPSQKTSSAKFQVRMAALAGSQTASQFPGGLILYGVSGGLSFGRIMTGDAQDEEIPNGNWNFYVIGWDGNANGDALSGKVYCALKEGVDLNGNPVEVELNATNAACAKTVFGNHTFLAAGNVHFPKIDIQTCNRLDHIIDSDSVCEYDYHFGSATPLYENTKGAARSYQILAVSYRRMDGYFMPDYNIVYRSGCSPVVSALGAGNGALSVNNFNGTANINLPPGSPGSPFTFILRSYYGSSNCKDNYGYKDIEMRRGASPANLHAKTFFDNVDTNVIFAKTTTKDVCSGKWEKSAVASVNHPFKGGAGSAGAPFVLCDGKDLNEINHNYSNGALLSHFILGRHIDMDPLTASLGSPQAAPCLTGMENFIPIGGIVEGSTNVSPVFQDDLTCLDYVATYGGTPETSSLDTDFSGVFDGNGHSILNLRALNPNATRFGFIRTLSGVLMNTNFEDLRITGQDKTGLIGQALAGAVVYNIYVGNGKIVGDINGTANSFVGGIAGHFEGDRMLDVTLENTHVKSIDGDFVGGIVGKAATASLSSLGNLYFLGEVDALGATYGSDYVGGLVGYLGAGVTLDGGTAVGNLKVDPNVNHGKDIGFVATGATAQNIVTTSMTINN